MNYHLQSPSFCEYSSISYLSCCLIIHSAKVYSLIAPPDSTPKNSVCIFASAVNIRLIVQNAVCRTRCCPRPPNSIMLKLGGSFRFPGFQPQPQMTHEAWMNCFEPRWLQLWTDSVVEVQSAVLAHCLICLSQKTPAV